MNDTASSANHVPATERPVGPVHAVCTGFAMGLANLVPGLSGGTLVLVMGLYERFVGAIAEVTSLKLRRSTIVFLGLMAVGIAFAFLGFAKVAVWAVVEQRTLAFSLFIGLTLGVVPELWHESRTDQGRGAGDSEPGARPSLVGTLVPILLGFGLVVGVEALDVASLEQSWWLFAIVGAIAASSMILPGISGSYVLLIFGMYETVVGSLPLLKEAPGEALSVLVPVGIGVAVGIGAFSNLLKFLLDRASRPTHAALLGLVLGSVVGLWPFENLLHPELAVRDQRKFVEAVVIDGATIDEAREQYPVAWSDLDAAEYVTKFRAIADERSARSGHDFDRNDMKLVQGEKARFTPTALQVVLSLVLAVGGFLLTRLLARVGARKG
ncbi:MAG: DUF368 domain-containing protein [Planctomycetota bacterium]